MSIVLALLLTALTFGVIAYPLLKQRPSQNEMPDEDASDELYTRRNTTYSMLKELEFDYQSGTLTEEDYKDLQEKYKKKAIDTLKDIDSINSGAEDEIEQPAKAAGQQNQQKPAGSDDEVEREVRRLRQGKTHQKPVGSDSQAGRKVTGQGPAQKLFCPQCGTRRVKNARFCAKCGSRLD